MSFFSNVLARSLINAHKLKNSHKYNINIDYIDINHYDLLHFINAGQFAVGYIKFMTHYFPNTKQLFITMPSQLCEPCQSLPNTLIFNSFTEAIEREEIILMAQQAKFVVFSGLFASQFALAVAPEWLIKKSFLQLWGGDFYNYRKNGCNILTSIMLPYFVKNCNLAKGLIFLIHGEENVFRSIIPLEHSRVYIAPMPGPPRRYEALEIPDKKINNKRILIGNSSTKENQHIDVFGKLGKNIQWNEVTDIEICSPLSYGDMMYKKKVETFGKRIFGNIFHSLDSFMPYDNYVQYLADCDVGIFNNNRQQAMGNIILLLRMGKKVYLNSHTSMWKHFQTIGCKVYDVDDLEHESVEEIFQFPSAYAEQNYAATTSYYSDENMVKQWEAIYDQVQE